MFDDFKPELGVVGRTPPKDAKRVPLPHPEDPQVYKGGPLDGQNVEVESDILYGDEMPIARAWYAEHEVVFLDRYGKRVCYDQLFTDQVASVPVVYSFDRRTRQWVYNPEPSNLEGRVAFGH